MASVLYIHGFLSSPQSFKARQVAQWLQSHRSDINYYCPQLPPYPDECAEILEAIIREAPQPVYLMGSSMGGFWATWLSEKYDLPAVLINPAVNVGELMPHYLHLPLKNYHHAAEYQLDERHLQQLARYVVDHPLHLENYWLLVQMGDETLNYRLAVEKYRGCRQTIEPNGDHSFQRFERFIPDTITFFEQHYS